MLVCHINFNNSPKKTLLEHCWETVNITIPEDGRYYTLNLKPPFGVHLKMFHLDDFMLTHMPRENTGGDVHVHSRAGSQSP